MRILSAVFDRLFLEGGFRRFVYRLLGGVGVIATVSELVTNGLTGDAYIYAVVTAGMLVCLYSDD